MTFIQSESLLNFPYDSRRKPVLARNIVVTSQPLAAQAGSDMLRRVGNAVDAALAAAIALTVVRTLWLPATGRNSAESGASDHRKDGQAVGF